MSSLRSSRSASRRASAETADASAEADARGKIERLEVMNFKSYRDHQIIGPFKNFTAVIGPNGAGKSNLMDCISFVLAVKTTQLRGNQLKDLIYKVDGESIARKAWVKIVYQHGDESETEFQRGIRTDGSGGASGTSDYKVNNRTVSLAKYEEELSKIGVLVKVRNFLVFQGEVEQLSQTSPQKLTELFEKISGSVEVKAEYEKLKMEKERSEEESLFSFQRKKGLMSERREVEAQKKEAERYAKLKKDADKARRQLRLFELSFNEGQIRDLKAQIDAHQEEEESSRRRKEIAEEKVKSTKREGTAMYKDQVKLEKRMAKDALELDREKSKHIKMKEHVAFLTRKLDNIAKGGKKQEKEAKRRKAERERVEANISELEVKLEGLKASAGNDEELELETEQMERYAVLKKAADEETFADRQVLDRIEREQQANRQDLHNLQVSRGEAEHRLKEQTDAIDDIGTRMERIDAEKEAKLAAAKSKEKQLAELKKSDVQSRNRQSELQGHLQRIHEQLRDARMDKREAERNAKRKAMVSELKRLYPGVYGRVVDLCKPAQRKYHVAVTVALGKDVESVVVDTEATARECIKYLREQRSGVCTFIPMDTIKTRPVDDSLRSLGGSSKLVIDIMQYDHQYERAMLYVCGQTLVFDNIDEARRTCLLGHKRYRGVTLDGTKLDKSGVMTGGISGVAQKAQMWEAKELDRLIENRDECERELSTLTRQRLPEKIQQLISEISAVEKGATFADDDKKVLAGKLKQCEKARGQIIKQVDDLKPKIEEAESSLADREESLVEARAKVSEAEDRIFKDFSAEIGMASIREYENKVLAKQSARAEEIATVSAQLTKLQSKLEYEKAREEESPLKQAEKRAEEVKAQLKERQDEETAQREKVASLKEASGDLQRQLVDMRSEMDVKETEIKELKKEAKEQYTLEMAAKKKVTAVETSLERCRHERTQILRSCTMEDIEIPLIDGDEDDVEEEEEEEEEEEDGGGRARRSSRKRKKSTGARRSAKRRSRSSAASVDDDDYVTLSESFTLVETRRRENDGEEGDEEDEDESADAEEEGRLVRIDFSEVPVAQLDATRAEKDELVADMRKKIKDCESEAQSMAPNLKASERLNEVKTRLNATSDEFSSQRDAAKGATDAFNKAKEERYTLFMAAFEHISQRIDQIYKELTTSPGEATESGGTAFLTLENNDEPYAGGIKFNAMPPMKRFRDMDQLSGGEKTVAAVALLFAIHSFHPSPFFVLDEVDAALDPGNVSKVAAYIAKRAAQGDLQCIVISLKDAFFDKAESLVGIYRDTDYNCSKTLSLDLEQFEEEGHAGAGADSEAVEAAA